jgi:hypothetical protein
MSGQAAYCPQDHTRFLAYVGQVMRSVIVDPARENLAQRRGAGAQHVEFDDAVGHLSDQPAQQIVQVNEALQDLSESEPELAKVLALEYFAGTSEAEIAVWAWTHQLGRWCQHQRCHGKHLQADPG